MTEALHKSRSPTITLKLDDIQRQRLKSLAEQKDRSSHYLMKEAIERYLVQEEAELAVLQSVDSEIANFEASGLHIGLGDIKVWAQDLKQNRSAQLPAWRA
jgi:predicted transcriptional regulator